MADMQTTPAQAGGQSGAINDRQLLEQLRGLEPLRKKEAAGQPLTLDEKKALDLGRAQVRLRSERKSAPQPARAGLGDLNDRQWLEELRRLEPIRKKKAAGESLTIEEQRSLALGCE